MRALYSAATGMMAQELNVQVISNNIANMRTTGYKRQQAHFQDLLYQTMRRAGATTSAQDTQTPSAVEIGSGVKAVSTARAMSQGNLTPTERDFDIAIRGEGFFQVNLPDGRIAYTRDGGFDLDGQGRLVTKDGYEVAPGITIPEDVQSVSISAAGHVEVTRAGAAEPEEVGRLQLVRFVNEVGLESLGDNLFGATAASGAPAEGLPNEEGFGSLQQGYLEEANVNAVTEISALISAQRAYEMNSRVISAADQMLQAASQMFRG
ncbi:flagellar basal-body rod protein FlgG [Salinarimonas ramus]|uniref:Flagellar basal-body rod protein FlgG n=1 Tax=Salinarimonas ramus TaxID=690164 RepID=A0A917QJN8_9HYPH|nr:flagellar basal-body rod protein FlgG [Salinarimonas ramus]GGK52290.1 flagellar basal-body rod protein FlgG [Salinarimonas ramus]